jgi:hypothetical protein
MVRRGEGKKAKEREPGSSFKLFRREKGTKEARQAEKARRKDERAKRLASLSDPERQALRPRPGDALSHLPLSHFATVFGCILILVLGLFALNYLAQSKNELGAEVSRLTREQQALRERNGHLKATLERLISLEDLEAISRESLGLRMPRTGQIVILD